MFYINELCNYFLKEEFMKNIDASTSVFALGGLGEIGKNMYVIETNQEILLIDAGLMFPEDQLLEIDYVIQDITYLKQKEKKIKALFITHGHEDHIGGITFLLQSIEIPKIYAPQIARDLIEKKLEDKNIRYDNLEVIISNSHTKFKSMNVEFVTTTHPIPDSFAIVVHTPIGIIIEVCPILAYPSPALKASTETARDRKILSL